MKLLWKNLSFNRDSQLYPWFCRSKVLSATRQVPGFGWWNPGKGSVDLWPLYGIFRGIRGRRSWRFEAILWLYAQSRQRSHNSYKRYGFALAVQPMGKHFTGTSTPKDSENGIQPIRYWESQLFQTYMVKLRNLVESNPVLWLFCPHIHQACRRPKCKSRGDCLRLNFLNT